MARPGAKVVDAKIHGGAVKPSGHILVGGRRQHRGIQAQKRFIRQLFRAAAIAEDPAQNSNNTWVSTQEELIEGLGRNRPGGCAGFLHSWFGRLNLLNYAL